VKNVVSINKRKLIISRPSTFPVNSTFQRECLSAGKFKTTPIVVE
jgi:hypothetical protein